MRTIDRKLRECLDEAVAIRVKALIAEQDALEAWRTAYAADPLAAATWRLYEAYLVAVHVEARAARHHREMLAEVKQLPTNNERKSQ